MRQPITTPDILPKSIHGGHSIGSNGIGDPETTITRFGSADGVFRVDIPEDSDADIDFYPYEDIEIYEISVVKFSSVTAGATITFSNVTRLGVSSIMSTVSIGNAAHSVSRATALQEPRLVLGKEGQRVRLKPSAGGIAGGAVAYIKFLNRSSLNQP